MTPIYWAPSGFSFAPSYQTIINTYLSNLAADSGKTTNVFASLTQYAGSNGGITYKIVAGAPIVDTTQYPASGCTVNSGSVYSDGSGYSVCLDDTQIRTETTSVLNAHGFPSDFGHLYVMFTPKGVESCFQAGNPSGQQCSINPSPSAAYCAYHSSFGSPSTVYANMPFPIYQSATGYSCTDENLGGGIQSPNGNTDADVEISPLSHEMSEAITDPQLNAWYDSSGNENGDDCAYIYGSLSGTPGTLYNQTINGGHYLTQEEFSNNDYVANVSGCIQQEEAASGVPSITGVSPNSGPTAGGQTVTLTGSNFTGATAVKFGPTRGTSLTVVSPSKITVHSPARAAGLVNVRVTTPGGTSAAVPADHYTFTASAAPSITSVSPNSGPVSGGQAVTIMGTNFAGTTAVKFSATPGTSVVVVSATKITVTTPARPAGLVNVRVITPSGTSPVVTADHYTFG
ncbi:MAG: IPT/TIG domain-containing protein [Jatrophihabitantaceae bacterium]